MKMYSVEWVCAGYHVIFMACVADSKDAAIQKFKAKFEAFKKEGDYKEIEFFTDGEDSDEIINSIKEMGIGDVSMYSHEE